MRPATRRAALAVLLAAVAIAFADSAIVVLALPHLLADFDASIESVSWVVTSYNLALAIAALALWAIRARGEPRWLALVGALVFLAASLACAAAPELWSLVAFRTIQGVGAALLLTGSLPLARSLAATPGRGTALWTGAGVFGAALGPALGGALTQAFDWRAIFVAQAPFAALAAVVALRRPAPGDTPARSVTASTRRRRTALAALALASAALVGLLFLAVIELVDIRRLSPLGAGLVVTVIPLAALAAAPIASRVTTGVAEAGAILLAGGLAGMAFVPGPGIGWVLGALAIAGLGYGLLVPAMSTAALGESDSGALSISIRHLGLVLGLVVLTPVLSADLDTAGNRAQLRGVAVVLDAPVTGTDKLDAAIALAPVLLAPSNKQLPNFTETLRGKSQPVASLGPALDAAVSATISRGFRRAYLVAALFAALALVPVALGAAGPPSLRAPAAALVVAGALVGLELAAGARTYGERPVLLPPCAKREQTGVGGGQELVLAGLDLVSCRLHETREQLVVNVARRGADAAHELEGLAALAGRLP